MKKTLVILTLMAAAIAASAHSNTAAPTPTPVPVQQGVPATGLTADDISAHPFIPPEGMTAEEAADSTGQTE